MTRFLKWTAMIVCLAAAALSVAVLLLPAVLGLQRYIIVGGSMTGTIDKGSVVYSRLTPVTALKKGDIITFVPPVDSEPVTHRIVSVDRSKSGELVFRTKGDANTTVDPWTITFPQPTMARYAFHIPLLGYPLALLSVRAIRMLLIGLPALVIAASILWSLWRSAGEEVRRQEAEKAALPGPQPAASAPDAD